MGRPRDNTNLSEYLYPAVEPFDKRVLSVGEGHEVYVEQCGCPTGVPVLVLHGGPGGGCSPVMRRYFDPATYRAILFDQRGCGRSRPYASVHANTTAHLVSDIERIRKEMDIDRWILFGGSWGAALALVYAQEHRKRVAYLVLRGVFLMTRCELDWFYGGGAARFWPDQWSQFIAPIPVDERGDLIKAYNKRLFSGDRREERRFGMSWFAWEDTLSGLDRPLRGSSGPGEYARTFARLENHYFTNGGFLERDGQILSRMHLLKDVPGTVVQGRYDMVCPPQAAHSLAASWPAGDLRIVPAAGHALSEFNISMELVQVMDDMRRKLPGMGL